jgi:hypothetical protein
MESGCAARPWTVICTPFGVTTYFDHFPWVPTYSHEPEPVRAERPVAREE